MHPHTSHDSIVTALHLEIDLRKLVHLNSCFLAYIPYRVNIPLLYSPLAKYLNLFRLTL